MRRSSADTPRGEYGAHRCVSRSTCGRKPCDTHIKRHGFTELLPTSSSIMPRTVSPSNASASHRESSSKMSLLLIVLVGGLVTSLRGRQLKNPNRELHFTDRPTAYYNSLEARARPTRIFCLFLNMDSVPKKKVLLKL